MGGGGIVVIIEGGPGPVGSGSGSVAGRWTSAGPTVFEVARPHWGSVAEWAERQNLATVRRRAVDAPSVTAWALLDGGVLRLYGYGLTTVAAGVFIVGVDALRLVLADIGLPLTCSDGEPDPGGESGAADVEVLRRRSRDTPNTDPSVVEQAELLATCTDEIMMRLVSATLLAETPAGTATRS